MYVRVISFGTNWWAMHSCDTERSVLLPAEGSLVQRRRLDVGKAASS